MPPSSFAANIAACQELLHDVRESLIMRGSQYMAENVERIQSSLYRLRQQHDAAIEQLQRNILTLQARHAEDKTALEEARKSERIQEERIRSRDATIEEQRRTIRRLNLANDEEVKKVEKAAFREGYRSGQEAIRSLEAQKETLTQAVAQRDSNIRGLKRDLEKARTEALTNVAAAYERGVREGKREERNQNRPPPTPPQPVIDILGRERVLSELKLTNSSGYTLSGNLEAAIKQGQPEVLSTVLQFEHPNVRAPALHIAALFGDVTSAELLLKAGANVKESCTARSENGGHLYGVTPMHLAVATQHEAMVRLFKRYGADFSFGTPPSGKRATATPAFWLLSDRWLRLTGKGDSQTVLRTLRTMKAYGWDPEAPVDKDGDSLRTVAYRNLSGRPQLRSDVVDFLQGRIN